MPASADSTYLAIDIGHDRLAAGVVNDRGEVLVRDRVATPQREVWPALQRLVRRVCKDCRELVTPTAEEIAGLGIEPDAFFRGAIKPPEVKGAMPMPPIRPSRSWWPRS